MTLFQRFLHWAMACPKASYGYHCLGRPEECGWEAER